MDEARRSCRCVCRMLRGRAIRVDKARRPENNQVPHDPQGGSVAPAHSKTTTTPLRVRPAGHSSGVAPRSPASRTGTLSGVLVRQNAVNACLRLRGALHLPDEAPPKHRGGRHAPRVPDVRRADKTALNPPARPAARSDSLSRSVLTQRGGCDTKILRWSLRVHCCCASLPKHETDKERQAENRRVAGVRFQLQLPHFALCVGRTGRFRIAQDEWAIERHNPKKETNKAREKLACVYVSAGPHVSRGWRSVRVRPLFPAQTTL